jgi:oligoribonuclease NrnB/cAMP/cGMP phosphodiesterase (DHH superfamily)
MTDHKDILVVYHGNCLDGWVAAWAAWRKFGDSAEYVPTNDAGDEVPYFLSVEDREVYILDWCPSRGLLMEGTASAKSLLVLDHHQSARDRCADLPYCQFDMERSGAGMAWDYFHPGAMRPLLVDYVEDRDLWRWNLFCSRWINAYLQSHSFRGQDFQKWSYLNDDLSNQGEFERVTGEGQAILRAREIDLSNYEHNVVRNMFAGYENVPIVNASGIIVSELLSRLAQDDSREDSFAVAWHQKADQSFKYSLRSKGSFDVAKLAEKFGGYGHMHAASFTSYQRPDELWSGPCETRTVTGPGPRNV